MAYWLDYSQGVLSASVIKANGYEGVIRYTTAPSLMNPPLSNPKHTTKAEFDDHKRNGIKQLLVMQGGTTDADGGWAQGVKNGQRALAGVNYLGYEGLIFFCNDRTTLPNPKSWQDYLDGAASVLGKHRVGAYGFGNAMDAAQGHAVAFWQAGRRSEVRSFVNFWQDNNYQPIVGGMKCDRNLPLVPMPKTNLEVPDMDKNQDQLLREIAVAVIDSSSPVYPGGNYVSLRDYIIAMDAKLFGLVSAVAALSNDQDITVEQMREIVNDAVENNIHITGTLEIGRKDEGE